MDMNFAMMYGAGKREKTIYLYRVVTPMTLLPLFQKLLKATGTTNRTRFLGVGRGRWLLGFSCYYIPSVVKGSHARKGVFVLIATIRKGSLIVPLHLAEPGWRKIRDRLYRKTNYHSVLKGFRREPIADTGQTYDVSGHHIPFKN